MTDDANIEIGGQTPAMDIASFARVAEAMPSIAFLYDCLEARILHVNQRVFKATGYTPEQFIAFGSEYVTRVIHPDDLPPLADRMGRWETASVTGDEEVFTSEYRVRHANGEWRWFRSRFSVFQRNAAGKATLLVGESEDITDVRRADESHREAQELFRQIFADSPIGMAVFEPNLQLTQVNKHLCDALGYLPEELIGKRCIDFTHPDDSHSDEEMIRQLFAEDSSFFTISKRYVRKNGEYIWANLTVGLIRDGEGTPQYGLGMLEDISARREAEIRLKEINSRLTLALDNSRHGIWDWLVKESKIIYDDNCHAIVGYEPGELSEFDEEVRNLVHPDDYPALLEAIERCVAFDNSFYDQVYRQRHKSGEWVWVNAIGRVVQRDMYGEAMRMVGTLHDVTARKMAEQELRESEERFRTLADSAPILIWSSGPDGGINYFSKRWLEFRGRTANQEKNRGWVEGVHPDDRELGTDIYRSSFKARQTFQSEFRLRRHDGEYRWMLGTGAPRYSPDGTFLGYIGTCLDITDQRSLQEQLYESQKLESLGRLAGGVAHDFNNLLTAIIGYSDLALSKTPENDDTHKFLTNVRNAGERAAELTSQLLMYARRQMVQFTIVDVNDVVLKMDPFLRRTIGESYEFVVNPIKNIWQVRSNAAQIEQVLMNLVVNARDAMPNGGRILIETANIVLDTDYASTHLDVVAGEYVMLAVSDNGVGMTKEVQERIFEPFYTTKEVGKGTGLGLATCYGIVRQSGGNIWVYSEPGQGTTFKIYLPRVKGESVTQSRPTAQKLPKGKETILLVDDEPLVRDIGARILREHGYQVLEAVNGEDALRVESESDIPIDMLLCDVVMPQMGGKELAQRMLERYPDLKVLYTSGYTQNVNLHEGILEPGLDLLVKPFSSGGLLEAVRATLDRE